MASKKTPAPGNRSPVRAGPPAADLKDLRSIVSEARDSFVGVVKRTNSSLVWRREADFALSLIGNDQRLQRCPPETLITAIKNVAYVGLSLNPIKQHATIIPRWITRRERYEAGLMVMYRGLVHLATEAGVSGIKVENVYKLDTFRYGSDNERGDWYSYELARGAAPDTEENPFEGVFVAATMPTQGVKVEWVHFTDIFKMREQSESYKDRDGKIIASSPWVRWAGEMYKKSGLKRAQKRWEEIMEDDAKWERFRNAIRIDNETEGVIQPRDSDIAGEAHEIEPTLTQPQIAEITSAINAKTPDPLKRDRLAGKICAAYAKASLHEIPQRHLKEILERLASAPPAAEKP